MRGYRSLDALVRARLRTWPQRPPGLNAVSFGPDAWLRGRPAGAISNGQQPFLKLPGSDKLRTLPDGLWLNFGGSAEEPFVDIFAIEACGSITNLLDKRSRFGASTHSLLAACPIPWLLAPAMPDDPTPRWKLTRVIRREPALPLVLPVRGVRVLYGLKPTDYYNFARNHVPAAHEFFVPMGALIAEGGDRDPAMQALVARTSIERNFLTFPDSEPSEGRQALADMMREARQGWKELEIGEDAPREIRAICNQAVRTIFNQPSHV